MSAADRASTAQRNLLDVLLRRANLVGRSRAVSYHTGPQWRPLFRACGSPMPPGPFSWPSVDDWMLDLTATQVSRAITHLEQVLS